MTTETTPKAKTPAPEEATAETGKTLKRIGLIFLGAAVAGPIIGIWVGKQILARRQCMQRPQPEEPVEPRRIEIPITPNRIAPTPPEPEPAATEEAGGDEAPKVYVASDERDKYHVEGCRWAKQIKAENRIVFQRWEQAEAQGYSPCGTCRPDQQ